MIRSMIDFHGIGLFNFVFLTCFLFATFVSSQSPYPTIPIISFCAGYYHACAVFDSNKMKCWGFRQSWGESGNNYGGSISTIGDNIPFINAGTGVHILQVSCGAYHICMKLTTGNVKCLGYNDQEQMGIGVPTSTILIGIYSGYIGDKLPVINLDTGVTVSSLACGAIHTCVLTTTSSVKCFGGNEFGSLGYGDTDNRGGSSSDMGSNLPYVNLGTGVTVASLHSSSSYQNCVILSAPVAFAQRIKCWGSNNYYQLGYGDINDRGDNPGEMGDSLPVVDLGTESKVKQIALGRFHTCALLITNILKCYGYEAYGQLASGSGSFVISSTGNSMPSVTLDSGKTISLMAAGYLHTCIVYSDQLTMKCVGDNYYGQLGQGDTSNRGDAPTTTLPNIPAIQLGTGSLSILSIYSANTFTCVIFTESSIKCFGENNSGQLAIGSTDDRGDGPGELGTSLPYAHLFSPTKSPTLPTRSPTMVPTFLPSFSPSITPTKLPTSSPTRPCNYDSAKICEYDDSCMWMKVGDIKQCVVFDCGVFTKRKCGKERRRCKWNKKTKICYPKIK